MPSQSCRSAHASGSYCNLCALDRWNSAMGWCTWRVLLIHMLLRRTRRNLAARRPAASSLRTFQKRRPILENPTRRMSLGSGKGQV